MKLNGLTDYCFSRYVKLFQKWVHISQKGINVLMQYGISSIYTIICHKIFEKKQFFSYQKWIKKKEPSKEILEKLKGDVDKFEYRPKISIITPVWNVDEKWLRLCIESVINQIYDNWELCLVDGNSSKPHIRRVLDEYGYKNSRIKIQFLTENKGIAGNSQEAVNLATGEFIGFLDHDDELAPNALFEVVKVLNENRSLVYIYSDEDKIDTKGVRKGPFFKPDWSPDMLLSVNYLCHFSVIRKDCFYEVGGFRGGFDGSQDHDLFLRITDRLQEGQIRHISKILYHWRLIPESASSSTSAKPYAMIAAKKAIADSLKRRKIPFNEVVDGTWFGSYRVKYRIQSNPEVAIIIHGGKNQDRCVHSIIEKTEYPHYKIHVIGNSKEQTSGYYHNNKYGKISEITYINNESERQFSGFINSIINQMFSPFIVLLNGDTEIISGEWLTAMLEHAQFDDVGAVGGFLLYPDNTIEHAGLIIGEPHIFSYSHQHWPHILGGYYGRATIIQNVSAINTDCMMMRTNLFKEIGGFDPNFNIAFYDIDLCFRLREKGYRIIFTPYSQLYHYFSKKRNHGSFQKKNTSYFSEYKLMNRKWGKSISEGDPYYNKNMNPDTGSFSVKI